MSEIGKCPWCGSEGARLCAPSGDDDNGPFCVICQADGCYAVGPQVDDAGEATDRWNELTQAPFRWKQARVRRVIFDVLGERVQQDEAWGEQNHDPFLYLAILQEEVGEAAKAALQTRFGGKHGGLHNLRDELVQVAAVAVAMIECVDRGKWTWGNHAETER